MEDTCPAGLFLVGAPAAGQTHRLLFRAPDVGNSLGPDHGAGAGPQFPVRQMLQVKMDPVQAVADDISIYRRRQILLSLSPGQQLPQLGGGYIYNMGQLEHTGLGPEGLLQILCLDVQSLAAVTLGAGKGTYSRQSGDPLGLPPVLQGKKHIGTHHQPQLRVGILGVDLLQRIRSVAFPGSGKLQSIDPNPIGQQQTVRRQLHHSQPLPGSGTAFRQFLVGRQRRRDKLQTVQLQNVHRRLSRGQMPQMGWIEGPAIDAQLHDHAPSFIMLSAFYPIPERSCLSYPFCGSDDTEQILFRSPAPRHYGWPQPVLPPPHGW